MSGSALYQRPPVIDDGTGMWRLAGASGLDLNSAYYYLIFCRDFADTSVVTVTDGGDLVGFVTGYRRPAAPDTLFVWQVAVDASVRRRGVGLAMLEHLRDRTAPRGVRYVEASWTPSNVASAWLFRSLATASAAAAIEVELFSSERFPTDDHEPEVLVRVGPFVPTSSQRAVPIRGAAHRPL